MSTKRLYTTTLLMGLCLLYVPSAHAEIYRWVDANGMTHFSDKAPKSLPNKKPRPRKTTSIRQVRKKVVTRKNTHQSRLSFPGKKKRKTVKFSQARKPVRVIKRAQVNKPVRVAIKRVRTNKPSRVKKNKRIEKVDQVSALTANLNATFYDMSVEPQQEAREQSQRKVITNIKQTLCTDRRMLLAALQEKGFRSYHNENGEYRVAWGVGGFYKEKRRYLTDEEVAKKTKGVIFEVEQYCDNPYDQKMQDKARIDWIRAEYCNVSRVILEDLSHPFMRASDQDIQDQTEEVKRFCSEHHSAKKYNDERYYPKSLQLKRLQQKHFLYR